MERKISSDMISLPRDFRHILHIDPHSANQETLSHLLNCNKSLLGEYEFEVEYDAPAEEEGEEENQAEAEHHHHHHQQQQQQHTADPDQPRGIRPHRPSNRVRKSMISRPTNFQHVNHISAGERLDAPSSPPPLEPTAEDPQDWKSESSGGVRMPDLDDDLDLQIAYYRIPPPPSPPPLPSLRTTTTTTTTPSAATITTTATTTTAHGDVTNTNHQSHQPFSQQVIERVRRIEEAKEEEEEEVVRWREERRHGWRETSVEEERERSPPLPPAPRPPPPSIRPPPIPSLPPPSLTRKKSIGKPTNFQHLKHLDPETADRLLEECGEERGNKDGERRRGREREREREKEKMPLSLSSSAPQVTPQDTQSQGKIRKSMIGRPTNFQHVAHIGL